MTDEPTHWIDLDGERWATDGACAVREDGPRPTHSPRGWLPREPNPALNGLGVDELPSGEDFGRMVSAATAPLLVELRPEPLYRGRRGCRRFLRPDGRPVDIADHYAVAMLGLEVMQPVDSHVAPATGWLDGEPVCIVMPQRPEDA